MQGFGESNVRETKAAFWKKNNKNVPGSIKPVYGAMHPPLTECPRASPKRDIRHKRNNSASSFQDFKDRTEDAWDTGDDEFWTVSDVKISPRVVQSTALTVITNHSQSTKTLTDPSKVSPPRFETTEESRAEALQRLASQKEPSSPVHKNQISSNIPVGLGHGPGIGIRQTPLRSRSSPVRRIPSDSRSDFEKNRLQKFCVLLKAANTNLNELRNLSWSGIPAQVRGITWRLLNGYLPPNQERRETTLTRKRKEYFSLVKHYFETRHEDIHEDTYRQIHIDIPRMSPLIPLFQQEVVQKIFERILYIWAIRHPASGYVQGINDLVTPFFIVFLKEHLDDDEILEQFDVAQLSQESRDQIESDCFWCVSHLLDGIQDNYTFAQPGIQSKINQLKELTQRINAPLHEHLTKHTIEYLQFSFRWMNNLLMRELPLHCTIRLWDTYHSEPDGFRSFHLYVCAAFLNCWSKDLLRQAEFQGLMLNLQNFDTRKWGDDEIKIMVAEAFRLKFMFADAPNHLQSN
uniref:Rab-GAP TBC domain-containing protein n=1 Tax=Strigamia maritima TaxID=126957 RepID=T1IWA3_STRMM